MLEKEVLFQSDVEALIGKRPFEEKKVLTDENVHTTAPSENGEAKTAIENETTKPDAQG